MKITDREIPLEEILSVFKGTIPMVRSNQARRESDGVIIVLSGGAKYDFLEHSFQVKEGDVFYLARDAGYQITLTQQPYRFICVNFSFRWPEGETLESEAFLMGGKTMENSFLKLLDLWQQGDFSDKLLCKAGFYEIYAGLIRSAAQRELAQEQTERLRAAAAYIRENYADPQLSVEMLAQRYGISTVHFRRTFVRLYHTSPVKYIAAIRLSKARELLLYTELPVSQICSLCGYGSVHYFDRVFKKEFGMQPLQLRKNTGR